jgi:hypothetical protein
MSNIIKFSISLLTSATLFLGLAQGISHAGTISGPTVTADFAKDALPPCGRAAMVIFNASHFDGIVYLHDTDIYLDSVQVKAIKALAQDGQIPAVCQVQGIPFVTIASR